MDYIEKMEQKINKQYKNVDGIVILKDGKTAYEKYFNDADASSLRHVFSVTKSIISILIGIAMDKGCIKSLDQKILDFYPEYQVEKGEKTIQNITLRDMMTMTVPYKYLIPRYDKYFASTDWVKSSLDLLGGRGKVGKFRYAPLIGPDILSGIIARTTGMSVLDFANDNLFNPLGITSKQTLRFNSKEEQMKFYKSKDINVWVADPKGINTAGWGLTMTAKDMAKIGQLYLDGGLWQGKQIISKKWIDESTERHSDGVGQGYGYLWWIINEKKRSFAAMGDGGNIIYVNRETGVVIGIICTMKHKIDPADWAMFIEREIEVIFE